LEDFQPFFEDLRVKLPRKSDFQNFRDFQNYQRDRRSVKGKGVGSSTGVTINGNAGFLGVVKVCVWVGQAELNVHVPILLDVN
jgi:hypothetical protein